MEKSMINIQNHKQKHLFDPWEFLSPKRRMQLDQSWPGLFKNVILPELPVQDVIPFFNENFGRPTKELYSTLGILVLQQTFDLTDNEACDQFSYNIQWHYALNILEESDAAKYICPKTLWTMRNLIAENSLDTIIFELATKKLADVFKVDVDKQRIDSVHIKSNMRRLGRISICATTINKFLRNLKRQHNDAFLEVSADLIEKYMPKKGIGCFSMVKPSDAQKTLCGVANDLFDIAQQFKSSEDVTTMHSYKLLERVLKEQCNLTKREGVVQVEVKNPKEIPSDSLQNPSDPDATYSGHKGQGYQVQIMETYTNTDDEEIKSNTLNLITHVEVEPAHNSDVNALIPAIEATEEKGLKPQEVLADSLYGSDSNREESAEKYDVKIIAPTMGSTSKEGITLNDFEVLDNGDVMACPQGYAPAVINKKKRISIGFAAHHCENCRNRESCPVKKGKKYYYLRFTKKTLRVTMRRKHEQSDEFKDRYRWRAGVEATMSEYDRRTGVKQLRVRGFKAVRFCATLKALGLNMLRAAVLWVVINPELSNKNIENEGLKHVIYLVKEQLGLIWSRLKIFFRRKEPWPYSNVPGPIF